MDWENERYVRVYCRDTGDLLVVGWIGRAVMWELMRKCDRAGIIDTIERPVLAELIRLPLDELNTGLDALIERRCVVEARLDGKAVLFIPNHMRAQEASSSDAQRQRESRARRHDKAKLDLVTICDEGPGGRDQQRDNQAAPSSQNVTNPRGAGHDPPVAGHSVPSLAELPLAEPSPAPLSDQVAEIYRETSGRTDLSIDDTQWNSKKQRAILDMVAWTRENGGIAALRRELQALAGDSFNLRQPVHVWADRLGTARQQVAPDASAFDDEEDDSEMLKREAEAHRG